MKAEILAIGTELLLGEIVDTNSAWLAARLADLGVEVWWSVRLGDDLDRVVEALRQALGRCDLVITVGGLGPTDDDITREAVARVIGEEPRVDPALEASLRRYFAERGRTMPEMNLKQAWLVPSAQSLPNPLGTAPGWLVRHQGRIIVTLPGPPWEMERMWLEEALPRLQLPSATLFRRTFKTWGLGESAVAELLGSWTRCPEPRVATYARLDGIHVRVAARGSTLEEAQARAAPALAAVEAALGPFIWGYDDDTLAGLARQLLMERGATLATLESLTGGMLGQEICAVPGASDVYLGGGVAYSASAKARFGVPSEVLERSGTVAEETARHMARAACRWFGADWGLATTGVAGPAEIEGKPVGTVFVGLQGPGREEVKALSLGPRPRHVVRQRTVYAALALLWRSLSPEPPG
jgi:nicotinamide-nucleotide amidase